MDGNSVAPRTRMIYTDVYTYGLSYKRTYIVKGVMVMVWSRFPVRRVVTISFDTNAEVARLLLELVQHYKMTKAQVLECIICQEHEEVCTPGPEQKNDFVIKPRVTEF